MNLIAYSLACLLICTNRFLSCICERLAKHAILNCVALVEMMSSKFMCLFWLRWESYACGGLLNLLIHFFHILAHGYLLVILYWSLCEDSLLFFKYWHNDVYNCLNTCLYALWSTLILISCIVLRSSLELCLMSSLPKGDRLCAKLVELLLIGWLREETW
jgi:hypothetical protein